MQLFSFDWNHKTRFHVEKSLSECFDRSKQWNDENFVWFFNRWLDAPFTLCLNTKEMPNKRSHAFAQIVPIHVNWKLKKKSVDDGRYRALNLENSCWRSKERRKKSFTIKSTRSPRGQPRIHNNSNKTIDAKRELAILLNCFFAFTPFDCSLGTLWPERVRLVFFPQSNSVKWRFETCPKTKQITVANNQVQNELKYEFRTKIAPLMKEWEKKSDQKS